MEIQHDRVRAFGHAVINRVKQQDEKHHSLQTNDGACNNNYFLSHTLCLIKQILYDFSLSPSLSLLLISLIDPQDYGTLLCYGSNELGSQTEPCVFNIIPAGKQKRFFQFATPTSSLSTSFHILPLLSHPPPPPPLFSHSHPMA